MTEREPSELDLSISFSWKDTAHILAVVLENGTWEGRIEARKELMRMAQAADLAVHKCILDGSENDL